MTQIYNLSKFVLVYYLFEGGCASTSVQQSLNILVIIYFTRRKLFIELSI